MARNARAISNPTTVDEELHRIFGLGRTIFEEAVRLADLERRRTTLNDLEGAGGFYAHTRALRALRELAVEHGYHRGKALSVPVTFNDDESVALTVSSGDEHTGRLTEKDPSTKNIKGGAAHYLIGSNRMLSNDGFSPFDADVWYLLFVVSDEGLWAEISRPTDVDEGGRIVEWSDRLILGRIDSGVAPRRRQPSPGAGTPTAELPQPLVRRRATS